MLKANLIQVSNSCFPKAMNTLQIRFNGFILSQPNIGKHPIFTDVTDYGHFHALVSSTHA